MKNWYAKENLYQCWLIVKKKGAQGGLDNRSIDDYADNLQTNLNKLSNNLALKKYIPDPGKQINIRETDGSVRPIAQTTVEDKIVQHALKQHIEPLFEEDFLDCSYAYRPKRGHRKAIHHLNHYLSQNLHWATTCDIDNFFDKIDHHLLFRMLKDKIKDSYILELIDMWLKIGAFIGERYLERKEGVPQGGVISPLLSNVYLHPFDVEMIRRKAHYIRYADDFIVVEKTKEKAQSHYQFSIQYLRQELKLELNPIPVPVFHLQDGFTYLGIHFKGETRTIDEKKFQKALDKIEKIFGKALHQPFHETIHNLNEKIDAWQYYYGECEDTYHFQAIQNKIFDKLAYLVYRMSEEGHRPEKSYLKKHLHRLKLFIDPDKNQKRGIYQQILSGKKRIDYQKAASKKTESKRIPKKHSKKSVDQTRVKRAIAARRSKYLRQFASDFDLVLSSYGMFLGRHSKRLVVRQSNGKTKEYSVNKIKHILVMNPSISFSSAAVFLCATNNIPIDFIDYTGKPFARLAAPEQPAWRYGMYQLEALNNQKGLVLAKAFVEGKVKNQRNLIKYFAKYRRKKDFRFSRLYSEELPVIDQYIEELERIDDDHDLNKVRGKLFGIEGQTARSYWRIVRKLLKGKAVFEGRKHRGASDLVNSLLNYGYGVLYSRVWGALMMAGLNVQISFLHCPQYEKPTLVFDMIEEFRTQVVDRVVISMLTRGENFNLNRKGYLVQESKNKLIENIFERLNTPVKFRKRDRSLQEVIFYQAREVGRYLKGERPSYQPYIAKW